MRILYLITELDRGGAEQALAQVARGVRESGHEVTVAALFHGDGSVGRDLTAAGIDVRDLGASGFHLGARWRFRELCAECQPDLIHSWLTRANVFCRWFAPKNVPLICSARVREHRKLNILLERFAPRTYASYLCVSSSVARFACEKLRVPQSKLKVIENGVDFNRFHPEGTGLDHPVESREGIPPQTETLVGLTVARVVREKGLDILVRALIQLPEDLDWQWHFAGAEADQKFTRELKGLLADSHWADRVFWHGKLSPDDVVKLYKNSNLFALSSHYEGQPNVVLEAMAAGLPVLASETDGILDLLKAVEPAREAIKIVSPNTAENWSGRITSLWLDQDRRTMLSENGLDLAKKRPWGQVAEQHLAIYKNISGS